MKRFLSIILFFSICCKGYAQEDSLFLTFSSEGGYHAAIEKLEITSSIETAKIFYTLNGSEPSQNALRYKKPIPIRKNTVVRAIAYHKGRKSALKSQTYLVKQPKTDFLTVCISIDPALLFDAETGLFVKGEDADSSIHQLGANFWDRSEYRAHVEVFEKDSSIIHNSLSGFRLFGGMSRLFPQKSMALVAREEYGEKRFRSRLFNNTKKKKFKFLVLRNSGSDWGKSHFRDVYMTSLVKKWNLDKQAYRPAHVYLNGKYWGIYNVREKVNVYFIESHNKGVHRDSVDLIEHQMSVKKGDDFYYKKLLEYLNNHNLSDPDVYKDVQYLMDVDNFMQYKVAQIFFDNKDAGGNIKFWRPHTPIGRWRWILYDTDWGFGLHDAKAYRNNSLVFHTEANGPDWPNPPWSTFILRKLLQNPTFKTRFINFFCDALNTNFHPNHSKALLAKLEEEYKLEMPRHFKRWKLKKRTRKKHLTIMETFAEKRPEYIRKYLKSYFELGAENNIDINIKGRGEVIINENIKLRGKNTFSGNYFEDIPVDLEAKPKLGHRFSHWIGVSAFKKERPSIKVNVGRVNNVVAVFEEIQDHLEEQVIINELVCNGKKKGDWIELYNKAEQTVNLKDWILKDNNNKFYFPDINIRPKDYLVLCQDSITFRSKYHTIDKFIGNLGFGLNKRHEKIQLYSSSGAQIDSIAYYLEPTDTLYTYELNKPSFDNERMENWSLRKGKGSPADANPIFKEESIKSNQKRYLLLGLLLASLIILATLYAKRRNIRA